MLSPVDKCDACGADACWFSLDAGLLQSPEQFVPSDLQLDSTRIVMRRNQARLFAGGLSDGEAKSIEPPTTQPFRNRIPDGKCVRRIILEGRPRGARLTNQCAQDGIDDPAPITLQLPDLGLGQVHGFD